VAAQGGTAFWRRLLDGWARIAGHFGEVQTLVLLGLVYGLVIGPVAVGLALARRDPLSKRGLGGHGSAWREADTRPPGLESARQPF
jgi:hypothetical protein